MEWDAATAGRPPAPTLLAKATAEFVGTFIFTFTVCCNNLTQGQLAPLSVGASLTAVIYALSRISGANFNPVVTLGLRLVSLLRKEPVDHGSALTYIVYHFFAGPAAGLAAGALWRSELWGPSSSSGRSDAHIEAGHISSSAEELGSPGGYGLAQIFSSEAIYTAILIFAYLCVATWGQEGAQELAPHRANNFYFGLAIGSVYIAGSVAIGHISSCALNPAVALGVALGAKLYREEPPGSEFSLWCLYSGAEFVGMLLAVVLYGGTWIAVKPGKADPPLWSRLLAEFCGTFVLVLTFSLRIAQASEAPIVGAVGVAAALMAMTYSLKDLSGSHFNPAVSIGLLVAGRLDVRDCTCYVCTQAAAGLAAVSCAVALEDADWQVALVARSSSAVVAGQGSWGAIVGSEIVFTFLMVFVFLNVVSAEVPNEFYGLAVGFVVIAGAVAVGGLSGGCMNPAVAFALDFGGLYNPSESHPTMGAFLFYTISELVGAVLAGAVYRVVRMVDDHEDHQQTLNRWEVSRDRGRDHLRSGPASRADEGDGESEEEALLPSKKAGVQRSGCLRLC